MFDPKSEDCGQRLAEGLPAADGGERPRDDRGGDGEGGEEPHLYCMGDAVIVERQRKFSCFYTTPSADSKSQETETAYTKYTKETYTQNKRNHSMDRRRRQLFTVKWKLQP